MGKIPNVKYIPTNLTVFQMNNITMLKEKKHNLRKY